jgi:hypothetical protein
MIRISFVLALFPSFHEAHRWRCIASSGGCHGHPPPLPPLRCTATKCSRKPTAVLSPGSIRNPPHHPTRATERRRHGRGRAPPLARVLPAEHRGRWLLRRRATPPTTGTSGTGSTPSPRGSTPSRSSMWPRSQASWDRVVAIRQSPLLTAWWRARPGLSTLIVVPCPCSFPSQVLLLLVRSIWLRDDM